MPALVSGALASDTGPLERAFATHGEDGKFLNAGFEALRVRLFLFASTKALSFFAYRTICKELMTCHLLLSRSSFSTHSKSEANGIVVEANAVHTGNVPRFVFLRSDRDYSPIIAKVCVLCYCCCF